MAIFEHCAFTTTFFLTQFFELFSALLHSKIMSSSYWAIRVFFYFRKWTQFVIFVAGWGSLVWHKKEAEKMQKWDKRESFGRVSKHTLSCFRKLAKKIYMTFHLTCPLPLKLREIFKSHSFSSFKIFKAFPSLSYATLPQNSNFCPKSRQKHGFWKSQKKSHLFGKS